MLLNLCYSYNDTILEHPTLLIYGGTGPTEVEVIDMTSKLRCYHESSSNLNATVSLGITGFVDGNDLVVCGSGVTRTQCHKIEIGNG